MVSNQTAAKLCDTGTHGTEAPCGRNIQTYSARCHQARRGCDVRNIPDQQSLPLWKHNSLVNRGETEEMRVTYCLNIISINWNSQKMYEQNENVGYTWIENSRKWFFQSHLYLQKFSVPARLRKYKLWRHFSLRPILYFDLASWGNGGLFRSRCTDK